MNMDQARARLSDPEWGLTFKFLLDLDGFMKWYLHGDDDFPRFPVFRCIVSGITFRLAIGSAASANNHGRGYAIAIDSGTGLQVYNAVVRLLAHPDTLRSHRSVPGRPLAGRLALPLLTSEGAILKFGPEGSDAIPPNDPKLLNGFKAICTYAHYFLFLHELAHVFDGHVERGAEIVREGQLLRPSQRQEFMEAHRFPLEFLADAYSVSLATNLLSTLVAGRRPPSDRSAQSEVLDHLAYWGFAVAVVFLLFETLSVPGAGTYPAASERAFYSRNFALAKSDGVPLGFTHVPAAEGFAAISRGYEEAFNAWDALGWYRKNTLPTDSQALAGTVNAEERKCARPPCMLAERHS
jgi:hypothetical protein